MEAKTYYEKAMSNNDSVFVLADRIGSRIGAMLGLAMWFVKDYTKCFLLDYLLCFLPWKTKKDSAAEERGLKYALSTIATLLVVGGVVQIYLLLLCN